MRDVSPHVALIGLPGVGKSTVAVPLALRRGVRAVDLDELIMEGAGRSIREIFAQEGEVAFRRLETETLALLLAGDEQLVLSCGGGVVLAPENRRVLKRRACCVWLKADVAVLAQRLRHNPSTRPLLADDLDTSLNRLAEERDELYRDAADVIVDVSDLEPSAVVDRVLAAVP